MKERRVLIDCLVLIVALTLLTTARADIAQLEEHPSAQPESELFATNITDVAGLYLEGYNYPIGSWVWAPGTFIPVLFQPMTIVWANTSDLPAGLAGITNFVPTTVENVSAWPLWVTLWPQSNTVTVLQPWSDETLTEFSVPDGFPSWEVYEASLRPSCILFGINYTNWETLVEEGYTQFSVPQVITHAWLMDVASRDVYWANYEAGCEAAEAATASTAVMGNRFMPMDDEDDGGGGGDPCTLTNLLQAFAATKITQTANGISITFQSCQFFQYLIFTASQLTSNTVWFPQAYVWGAPGHSSTTWTDSATTNNDGSTITQRFYRIQRLLGSPVAAGGYHSLVISTNSTPWAWGGDDQGQLGDGATSDELFPVEVTDDPCSGVSVSNLVTVAAGYDYSVAADANGVAWTWGQDDDGQLANGADGITQVLPSPISGPSNIVSVAAGYQHTLVLQSDGTVWASGDGTYGQLGDGAANLVHHTNYLGQSLFPTGTVIVAIAAGYDHSVALDTSGRVWTYGKGYDPNSNFPSGGQLGNGGTTNVGNPVMLTTISNIVAIAGGFSHTVALAADKTVWTWGDNQHGELGRTVTNACVCDPLPGQVPGLSNVVAIAGGVYFTVAARDSGQVYAWGWNPFGSLGTNASAVGSTNRPMLVAGVSNAVLVSAQSGGWHSLALTTDQGTNQIWAWGLNNHDQVGTTSGNLTNGQVYEPSPNELPLCDSCVQLGTGGVFTANCTGTLVLYFNDSLCAFYNNSGSYTATVVNVATNVIVMGNNGQGAVAGVVTNGGIYAYTASGYCNWDDTDLGLQADPNGDDTNGVPVDCGASGALDTVCPSAPCVSLVGRIQ